jgi:hypothetical protein
MFITGRQLRHGMPPLVKTFRASPGSVPLEKEHAQCEREEREFPVLLQTPDNVSFARNNVYEDELHFTSQSDIVFYVRCYLNCILGAMSLSLRIQATEIAVKHIRSGICVLWMDHQVVGIVQMKTPGSGSGGSSILLQPTVLGDLFDQMLLVEGFYGMGPVCGILTTGEEWLVAWFDADQALLSETLSDPLVRTHEKKTSSSHSSDSAPEDKQQSSGGGRALRFRSLLSLLTVLSVMVSLVMMLLM